jgi:ribosomal protein L3 glutamine methyltransferase
MSAHQQLNTIADLIRYCFSQMQKAELYYGHGTDNAWDEACALVLQSIDMPFDTPEFWLQCRLTEDEKHLILQRLERRINERLPLPYLTNKAYFCGLEFYCDQRTLVPRSPIAEMIERQFKPWIDPERVSSILDLCTGSGCIAIACAHYFPDSYVIGSDISEDCIKVAEKNKRKLNIENVEFLQSDLFDKIPAEKFDIIVSNPPYVDAEDFAEIPPEFKAEPQLGLVAGQDGLDLTRRILKDAAKFLADDGILVVEVGNSALALEQAFPDVAFTWLEFERGGHGVFLLEKQQLTAFDEF